MIITLEQVRTNQNVDNVTTTTSYTTAATAKKAEGSGYKLDIAGKVMDNEAYGSQGKTLEAVMQQAQLQDTTVQKNFLTVMSSSVSGEDLKAMQEEGYSAGSTDVDTYVDIVDRIKVTLAKSGVVIAGYNDDLQEDVVAEITGSVGEAEVLSNSFSQHGIEKNKENIVTALQAINKALSITELSDGTLQYMVKNGITPTIENTYMAQFSATTEGCQAQGYFSDGTGYYARKAQNFDWQQLSGQMEQVCKEAGMTDSTEEMQAAMENSRFLVEQGIPLTAENLQMLTALKDIDLPKNFKELADLTAGAIANGKRPEDANLLGEDNIYQKANDILEEVLAITPEAVDEVFAQGRNINLKNLSAVQKQIITKKQESESSILTEEEAQEGSSNTISEYQLTKAKRQLAEVQLMMTTQANVKLLKSGYQIETSSLEDLVKNLKNMEEQEQKLLFKGENTEKNVENAQLFAETVEKTNALPTLPAAVLGKAVESGEPFTIGYIHKEGTILKSTYEDAGQTYEALMTSPRKDLGDSIKKAFQNVDDILQDMNLEASEENRRAVRILSYNSMSITTQNIQSVKSADLTVQNVMQKMTPGATVQMIRDGINPLKVSMQELESYLDSQDAAFEKQAEKYSDYLYKLEQNQKITKEERDTYIGVYRLFRQIEKSDGAVIGSLVGQQAEINMKNLLSAVRSQKAKGIDVSVDEDFGGLEKLIGKGSSISDQIMSSFTQSKSDSQEMSEEQRQQADYYERLVKSVREQISPEQLQKSQLLESQNFAEISLEQVADALHNTEVQEKYSEAYYEQQLASCKQLAECEEDVIQMLMDYDQSVTMDNLLAANVLMHKRGSLFKEIGVLSDTMESEDGYNESKESIISNILEKTISYQDSVRQLADHFDSNETAGQAYEEMIQSATELLEESIESNNVTSLDVRAANLLYKQLSLASRLAKEENYEIPVTINGETTSVNLRIIHDSEKKGKVNVTMETEVLGQVGAELEVTENRVSGYIVYKEAGSLEQLTMAKNSLEESLENTSDKEISIQMIPSRMLDIHKFSESSRKASENKGMENVATKDLYQIAMYVIKGLQSM